MISQLSGLVAEVSLRAATIVVGGIGMEVNATPRTLSRLRVGEQATVCTTLIVREDSLTLFGFDSSDERAVFDALLGVQGVGPRLGLAVLAVLTPDELRVAVANDDEKALTRVPGVGKKSASRMILDLAGKIGEPVAGGGAGTAAATSAVDGGEQVHQALLELGWNASAADDALQAARAASPAADAATLLRSALAHLGGSR